MFMSICGFDCKSCNEFCYKDLVHGMVVMFSLRCHYEYCNELGYKSLWGSMFRFLVVLLVIGIIEQHG